jgi:hypothetical protein
VHCDSGSSLGNARESFGKRESYRSLRVLNSNDLESRVRTSQETAEGFGDLQSRVWISSVTAKGLEFRVQGLGFRVWISSETAKGLEFRVQGSGIRVWISSETAKGLGHKGEPDSE